MNSCTSRKPTHPWPVIQSFGLSPIIWSGNCLKAPCTFYSSPIQHSSGALPLPGPPPPGGRGEGNLPSVRYASVWELLDGTIQGSPGISSPWNMAVEKSPFQISAQGFVSAKSIKETADESPTGWRMRSPEIASTLHGNNHKLRNGGQTARQSLKLPPISSLQFLGNQPLPVGWIYGG